MSAKRTSFSVNGKMSVAFDTLDYAKELEEPLTYRLPLRMGTMLAAAVGVFAALNKIL